MTEYKPFVLEQEMSRRRKYDKRECNITRKKGRECNIKARKNKATKELEHQLISSEIN
jgi:hypothetical protein